MPGIINQQMEQPTEQPAEQPAQAAAQPVEGQPGKGKFRSNVVSALPENLKEPFERVVLAGMKVMFSEQMQDDIQQALAGEKPMFQKLAESVTGLMGLLYKQSKGMPKEVIIPAAIELLHEAAAYVTESGMGKVSPEELKQSIQYLVVLMLHGQGANAQQITQAMTGAQPGQPEQPAQPAQPAEA